MWTRFREAFESPAAGRPPVVVATIPIRAKQGGRWHPKTVAAVLGAAG